MVKKEEYYNVNGTTTSFGDLFDKYGMQTEEVIKNEGYKLILSCLLHTPFVPRYNQDQSLRVYRFLHKMIAL